MAEFCLDCWNKINGTSDSKRKYILSKDFDLCEECGEWKHVIIMARKTFYMQSIRYLILPFRIIFITLSFIWQLLTIPFSLYFNSHQRHEKSR